MPPDDTDEDSRQFGVELGDLEKKLETHDYPATSTELIDAYGDEEITLPDGEETFEEVLSVMSQDETEYADVDEVRQAIYNAIGSEAVGREGYSDRGGMSEDEEEEADQESL
jgi:hypothetical protein